MSCNLFENWMTEPLMAAFDERVSAARTVLHGWSDAKVRRVERYLRRISELARARKWALALEARQPKLFLSRITEAERLAVNILRLCAKGMDEEADRDLIAEEYARLCVIQTRRSLAHKEKKADAYGDHQSKNSSKKRGRVGDAGESMDALIKRLVRSHPGMAAIELWPHLGSALEELAGSCTLKHKNPRKTRLDHAFYEYDSPRSKKGHATIGYETFRDKVGVFKNE